MQLSGPAPHRSAIKDELDARFRASLLAYFLRRTGNTQEAEDLTQETFVRLIGSHSFEMAEEAQAFVFRVASNLCETGGGRKAGCGVSPPCRSIPRVWKNLNPGWWRI